MSADDEEKLDSEETNTTEEVDKTTDDTTEGESVEHTEFEKKQYERAKKAEAELKEAKAKAKALEDELKKTKSIESNKSINAPANPEEFAKEVRLLATMSDEEIEEVRFIAKGRGIPLEEAVKTKSFKAFQKELKDEERKEKAKLGASKGSDQESDKNEFDTGVTPEGDKAHREAWKKAVGR